MTEAVLAAEAGEQDEADDRDRVDTAEREGADQVVALEDGEGDDDRRSENGEQHVGDSLRFSGAAHRRAAPNSPPGRNSSRRSKPRKASASLYCEEMNA